MLPKILKLDTYNVITALEDHTVHHTEPSVSVKSFGHHFTSQFNPVRYRHEGVSETILAQVVNNLALALATGELSDENTDMTSELAEKIVERSKELKTILGEQFADRN